MVNPSNYKTRITPTPTTRPTPTPTTRPMPTNRPTHTPTTRPTPTNRPTPTPTTRPTPTNRPPHTNRPTHTPSTRPMPTNRPTPTPTTRPMPTNRPTPTPTTRPTPSIRPTPTSLPSWVLESREEAQIARRRGLLQERAVRIHQPRTTSIAVDVEGLKEQVEEKQRLEERERRRESEVGELVARQDRTAALLDNQYNQKEAMQKQELSRYWKEEQRPERRREYDLNSHQHVTSALYQLSFEGEDLAKGEREKQQRQEMKVWLTQQTQDKQQQQQQEKHKTREEEVAQSEMRARARHLEEVKEDLRLAERRAIQQYNIHLSEERAASRESQRQRERRENEQEVKNAVLGSLLTEDPNVAHSALGPHRVLTDRWKGMTQEQRQVIQATRVQQMQRAKMREYEEGQREKEWQELASRNDRVAQLGHHYSTLNHNGFYSHFCSRTTSARSSFLKPQGVWSRAVRRTHPLFAANPSLLVMEAWVEGPTPAPRHSHPGRLISSYAVPKHLSLVGCAGRSSS
ncbi:hypothetical protein Pcinc_041377 [Petrolisthes cinctipes]|uniref:Uncharacterized protein n=1 Tax=Petrolisthes cinctipes TaxID=88211 RepID=A0AAE1BJZ5_PETCI|nr:hypothetical protein Pcinc_041377 [Petrolisthes cinctipes]